jgi:hypothetical protein
MERNTLTTFQELKLHDRFYLKNDKNKIVYEIVSVDGNVKCYNCLNVFGKKVLPHDILCRPQHEVVFLRNSKTKTFE